jgi:hypothetical protein
MNTGPTLKSKAAAQPSSEEELAKAVSQEPRPA